MAECNGNGCKQDVTKTQFCYEAAVALAERTIKRLWLLCILLLLALVGSNISWVVYDASWSDEVTTTTTTYTADATDGGNAIANGDGSVTVNGTRNNDKDNNNP